MTLQTADVIAFPVGVSREQFLKAARSRRKTIRPTCTVEIEEDEADEIDCQARKERKARKAEKAAERALYRPVTAINSDLRKERQEVWRMAGAATRYWRNRLDFHGTLRDVQEYGMPEGRNHPTVTDDDRWPLLNNWRAALVKQLLTPAHDANSVKWKQETFAGGQHKYTDTNPKKIERAIADDLEWLAAHPTRRSIRATKKHDQ